MNKNKIMIVRKKSKEILKQQKESFFNFIKTKEKYSAAIADLFFDDEIEEINDIEEVKHHLEEKGISKELMDELEMDYIKYLRNHDYYGKGDEYSHEMKESIKENDKILHKIKINILKEYKRSKDFITMDIKSFINDELTFFDIETTKDIGNEIMGLEQEIERNKIDIKKGQELLSESEKELGKTSIFQLSKKKQFKTEILKRQEIIKDLEEKIEEKKDLLRQKQVQDGKIRKLRTTSKDLIGLKNWTNIESCRQSIMEIKNELIEYIEYIPKDLITRMKEFIENNIIEQFDLQNESLATSINEYLNYLYFGENKNYGFIRYDKSFRKSIIGKMGKASTGGVVPTLYGKNHIDMQIVRILEGLGGKLETGNEKVIDKSFMDDIFIHTTGFDVLDEILNEGGLISTNEARRRASQNNDIEKSITQKHAQHKDIYFSRGFRKNGYGYHERDDDYVFIVNTMNAFARNGYGVPLNGKMQCNVTDGFTNGNQGGDSDGYSIISESALKKSYYGDSSYSKIDVKDVYIFLPESKKQIIEHNPKYKIGNANIIYIPKQYGGKMSYEIYEFIKSEIKAREQREEMPIPKKIITNDDGIESINTGYEWAFCESVNGDNEVIFNPIKDGNSGKIIQFIEKYYDEFQLSKKNIDLQRLKGFLSEQKNRIDNINFPFEYPRELAIFAIAFIKIGLSPGTDEDGRTIYNKIGKKLAEFGYSSRELGILYKLVQEICRMKDFKYLIERRDVMFIGRLQDIKNWCNDWQIEFDQMKELLIEISGISLNRYIADIVKKELK